MIRPTEMPDDLQIARRARLRPMPEIAAQMGIQERFLEPYGEAVAKIRLEAIE
ncbi:MAG: formate--tetrahydrofolate ligase, partial [Actinomycetota bacterium]